MAIFAPPSPTLLWQQAVGLHRAGRLAEAIGAYRDFLRAEPAHLEGRFNLGMALASHGKLEDAESAFRDTLKLRRDFPEGWLNLGNVLKALGRPGEAVEAFRKALALRPGFAPALYNLGNALTELGRNDEAITAFSRVVAIAPDMTQAHNNLGNLHFQRSDWNKAADAFTTALALRPQWPEAQNNLGMALQKAGRLPDAQNAFRAAIRQRPGFLNALENLGSLLLEIGHTEEAFRCLTERTLLWREPPGDHSAQRIRHDREQEAHRGAPVDSKVEIAGGERLTGGTINSALDVACIQQTWNTSQPQLVVIEDFLTPEALAQLRGVCLDSTIWRQSFDGYLGANLQSGLACPLLAQIAGEFSAAFPEIFRDHPLLYAWAFKYEPGATGTGVHADFAAVNVNFWITPDEANTDPQSGGLLVWDVVAPLDWDFARYNGDENAMRGFLREHGATATRIPYRANRAVVFDSDLFHETDRMAFLPGYENRRINITLLYGFRENHR